MILNLKIGHKDKSHLQIHYLYLYFQVHLILNFFEFYIVNFYHLNLKSFQWCWYQ
jgi:hypothetical protein